ncbi:hypothetical protein [Asticcacaulis sp. YBE204]|uniref:hypothetical protein n=1 Tax=Asticcacaulis sp. YBE204 TaxID=1282363 RepID=UPI0003C3CDC9|nr:hypothetical protein [Asticcacaulis sp. YBE204]ESQ78635.1 hypothetical protein AEYBE204_13875 [Asticcacaulis sp. YBE204]
MAQHETNETSTSVQSRVFWLALSLLIAALFFYAASTTTGEAYAQGMGEGAASASDWSGSASSEDASM